MIGACTIGKRRLLDVLERYGVDVVRAPHGLRHRGFGAARARGDRALAGRRLPRRELDGLGRPRPDGAVPRSPCEITVAGPEITFDFSDSDDQAPGFTNMPPASATGAVRIAFLMLIDGGRHRRADEPRAVRADQDGVPRGLAAEPALPRRRRSSATRCATRCSRRSCWRSPLPCPTASPRGGTSSCAPSLAGVDPRTGAPSVTLTIFQRGGPGAMRGADGFDALGFTGHPGVDALARSRDVRAVDAAHHARVRVPARLGGRGRVARRATARSRPGASTARTSSA